MFDKIIKIAILVVLIAVLFAVLYVLITGTITIRTKWGASKMGLGRGLRDSCLICVRKHLSKAVVLLSETNLGYPQHFWLAMGNLSEAEDEAVKAYPALATKIREYRGKLIAGDKNTNIMDLIEDASNLASGITVNTAKF